MKVIGQQFGPSTCVMVGQQSLVKEAHRAAGCFIATKCCNGLPCLHMEFVQACTGACSRVHLLA